MKCVGAAANTEWPLEPVRSDAWRCARRGLLLRLMKILPRTIAGLGLLLSVPAHAIVGGGAPSTEGVARSVVTIVGSRGNFCTGALIAPKLVLTAAH